VGVFGQLIFAYIKIIKRLEFVLLISMKNKNKKFLRKREE
jgi:hypothetical protein